MAGEVRGSVDRRSKAVEADLAAGWHTCKCEKRGWRDLTMSGAISSWGCTGLRYLVRGEMRCQSAAEAIERGPGEQGNERCAMANQGAWIGADAIDGAICVLPP